MITQIVFYEEKNSNHYVHSEYKDRRTHSALNEKYYAMPKRLKLEF